MCFKLSDQVVKILLNCSVGYLKSYQTESNLEIINKNIQQSFRNKLFVGKIIIDVDGIFVKKFWF